MLVQAGAGGRADGLGAEADPHHIGGALGGMGPEAVGLDPRMKKPEGQFGAVLPKVGRTLLWV